MRVCFFGKFRKTISNPLSAGIIMMVGCVFFIASGSIFAETLLGNFSAPQVLWLRFIGYIAIMAPITLTTHFKATVNPYGLTSQIACGVLGFMAALLLLLAIRDIGASQAIAVFYIYPAVTYLAGVTWLGEPSYPAKWAAVGLGFVGVLVAIQPAIYQSGVFAFEASIGYALAAAALASGRIALHRVNREKSAPMASALWDRGVGAVLATGLIVFIWEPISVSSYGAVLGLILSSIAAQLLLVFAVAKAPLGTLAPITYWEVIFVIILDYAIHGAPISYNMAVGALLIACSGIIFRISKL